MKQLQKFVCYALFVSTFIIMLPEHVFAAKTFDLSDEKFVHTSSTGDDNGTIKHRFVVQDGDTRTDTALYFTPEGASSELKGITGTLFNDLREDPANGNKKIVKVYNLSKPLESYNEPRLSLVVQEVGGALYVVNMFFTLPGTPGLAGFGKVCPTIEAVYSASAPALTIGPSGHIEYGEGSSFWSCFFDAKRVIDNMSDYNINIGSSQGQISKAIAPTPEWIPYLLAFYNKRVAEGPRFVMESTNNASIEPTKAEQDKCKSLQLTGPFSENDDYKKLLIGLKEDIGKIFENQAQTNEFNDLLGDPVDAVKDKDREYYQKFYMANSSHAFPDMVVNEEYVSNYKNIVDGTEINKFYAGMVNQGDGSLGTAAATTAGATVLTVWGSRVAAAKVMQGLTSSSTLAASGASRFATSTFIGSGAIRALFSGLASASGASSAALTAAGPWVLPVLLLGILAYVVYHDLKGDGNIFSDAINKWIDGINKDDYVKSVFRLMVAYFYVQANRNYQKCTETWGKVSGQEDNYQEITLLAKSSLDGLKEAFSTIPADTCSAGGVKDMLSITKMMRAAFCSLGMILKDWADSFMCFAQQQLAQSIGLENMPLSVTVKCNTKGSTSYPGELTLPSTK